MIAGLGGGPEGWRAAAPKTLITPALCSENRGWFRWIFTYLQVPQSGMWIFSCP
jgi:hypothetical protein